ncbi:MAG: hypothetical protein L3J38_01530 [Thiomicrorhabdus sp.]|nr:hypothetical protein [Thiomicrorhabdus sp.]
MSMWLSRFDPVFLSHYFSRVVLVTAVLLLGWLLGSMLSFSLQSPTALSVPSVLQKSTSSSSPPPRAITIDLLGRQMIDDTRARQKNEQDVTETRLNLEVLGIVALPDDKGLVIIKSGGQTLLVLVGEKIQNGVYLDAVYSDYVVIDNHGALEKLMMSESNELLKSDAFGLNDRNESGFGALKKELKKSPMKIMQYVRFQLINAGKQDASMKLWPKKEAELFNELGLEPGDILKMVNGRSIAQLTQKPHLWIKVLNEPVLEMEVERQGQVTYLVVELK